MLTSEIEIKVRFSETDAMGVVWHGNYLKFFEDGREAFGEEFGIPYLDVYNKGFFIPIVKTEIDYKASVRFGQSVKIRTRFIPSRAAKIVFEYEVMNANTGELAAKGKTVQVFTSRDDGTLQLLIPDFYAEWLKNYNLIE